MKREEPGYIFFSNDSQRTRYILFVWWGAISRVLDHALPRLFGTIPEEEKEKENET